MKINVEARGKGDPGIEYKPLEQVGLHASINEISGYGLLSDPRIVRITLQNKMMNRWEGVVHVALTFPCKNPRFFLPGFMYGRNRGEAPLTVPNEFPRIREVLCRPASPWWMVRSDRLSHPAAFAFDEQRLYGIFGSPYFVLQGNQKIGWIPGRKGPFFQYAGFTCSLEAGSIGYTLGYENAPWMFVKSQDVRERAPLGTNCFRLDAGEEVTFELSLIDCEVEDTRVIYDAVRTVYDFWHESPRVSGTPCEAVSDIALAVYRDAWNEEDKNYFGFVFDDPDGFGYQKLNSISWTNGLAVAMPMLRAALRLNQESIRTQALACIDNIVRNSLNPASGLPYESFNAGTWSNYGWWFDKMHTPGHSSYLIGQAIYYILTAYELEEREKGALHPDWLHFAETVLVKLEQSKNADLEYPYILSENTGAGLEYDSMAGTWCLAACARFNFIQPDAVRLQGLCASEAHYYRHFIAKAECYGGPLDTDKATDSEGVLAYIRAVRWLHSITGNEIYLDHLRDALYYEFSFKFCYNSPIKTPPLSKIGWSSCGGSITSVANPHIHPMSSTVIDEMYYYLRYRNDTYVRNRLEDTLHWSCQTYNRFDKEYGYGLKGWMSERFCHSEGLVVEKYPDGQPASTWFALMPWAAGCILEGLSGDGWDDSLLE